MYIQVALRKESVDRNHSRLSDSITRNKSLSARRAWIEIFVPYTYPFGSFVALRKESVDRNSDMVLFIKRTARRSPQGERG